MSTGRPGSGRMNTCRRPNRTYAALIAASICSPCMADCTASATGLDFGTYDVFSTIDQDITGSITVRCRPGVPYAISLSPGSGTYAARTLRNGPYALQYNLYLDATRLTIWGDGSVGTGTVSGNAKDAVHSVYGRIPARQNAHTGSYSDTVTVTITF